MEVVKDVRETISLLPLGEGAAWMVWFICVHGQEELVGCFNMQRHVLLEVCEEPRSRFWVSDSIVSHGSELLHIRCIRTGTIFSGLADPVC